MLRTLCILAILFSCVAVRAQDEPTTQPKSLQAKQAETKFALDMQKLDAEYQQKAAAIKQTYIDDLKTVLRTLAQKADSDPDEIAKLSAKIKEVEATGIQPPMAAQQVKRISGNWKCAWPRGSEIRIFRKNGALVNSAGKQISTWIQDGSAVIFCWPRGNYEHFVLSGDGKSLSCVFPVHVDFTYTFNGD